MAKLSRTHCTELNVLSSFVNYISSYAICAKTHLSDLGDGAAKENAPNGLSGNGEGVPTLYSSPSCAIEELVRPENLNKAHESLR